MQYVIIGSSAAGINAIEAIRTKDKTSKIIIISDEKNPLYSRCLISYLLAGTIDGKKIWYKPDSFFKDNKVEALLGIKAEKINIKKKEIAIGNKEKIKFDKLLIATGASPKLEDIPGIDKKGVFPLRTIEHTTEIQSMLDKVKSVAVLGGGLIGLRAAYALKNRGKNVSVFVKSGSILSQIIDKDAAGIMQKRIEERGIKIFTGVAAKEITGAKSVDGVALDNGSKHDCELVIIGKGVSPNVEIAKDAGIKTSWGILANERLRTGVEDIFTAGDVSETNDIALEESSINAIWPAACEQGRIAGLNMTGENETYEGSLAMNSIEFFGLPVISVGITKPKSDRYKEIVKKDAGKNIYKKIVLKDGIIVGVIFVNSIENIGIIGTLIKNKADVTSIKDIMLEDYFDYGKIAPLIKKSKRGFKEPEFKETIMTL
ncbi:MAG: FAD-dependent oxidoreductase [Candidatus Omnitrophica bacterium]|nr:FAD-dependent oxidoreductase [Candidatus Omnitrophota bacterium]